MEELVRELGGFITRLVYQPGYVIIGHGQEIHARWNSVTLNFLAHSWVMVLAENAFWQV